MRRKARIATTAALGCSLVSAIFCSGFALAGTNTLSTKKPAIVKLRPMNHNTTVCTGAVIGINPLAILTAFHCLSHHTKGGIRIALEDELAEFDADPSKFTSTRAIVSPQLTRTAAFQSLSQISENLVINSRLEQRFLELLLKSGPNPPVEAELDSVRRDIFLASRDYKTQLMQVIEIATSSQTLIDLAIVTFDKYDGKLHQSSLRELIEAGKLLPLAPSRNLTNQTVSFAGYGQKNAKEQRPNEDLGAFTNIIRSQYNGYLATFGIAELSKMKPGTFASGEMGMVLPGDSGGPLMNTDGIVGVASYIKGMNTPFTGLLIDKQENLTPPAPDWPRDIDGFYSYGASRFADLSSPSALDLLDIAERDHGVSFYRNKGIDFELTSIQSWVPESKMPPDDDLLRPAQDAALAVAPAP